MRELCYRKEGALREVGLYLQGHMLGHVSMPGQCKSLKVEVTVAHVTEVLVICECYFLLLFVYFVFASADRLKHSCNGI